MSLGQAFHPLYILLLFFPHGLGWCHGMQRAYSRMAAAYVEERFRKGEGRRGSKRELLD